MPTAVIRVVVDAAGELSLADYAAGVQRLRDRGVALIASPPEHVTDRDREIEILVDSALRVEDEEYLQMCAAAFGVLPQLGVTTYISRGTDDDALGVLTRFGLTGEVEREFNGEDDIVTVTVAADERRRVPESRLHTALEAALNAEVRLRYV